MRRRDEEMRRRDEEKRRSASFRHPHSRYNFVCLPSVFFLPPSSFFRYLQCLDILREVGDTAKEARILYNISHSYLSLTQHEDALKYLQQSLEMTGDRVR